MKIGISIKLDVTKIVKERLFKGERGTYLDLTTFIDTDKPSQYGDHGFVSQTVSKDEKAKGIQTPILGNCRVFWGPQEGQSQQNQGHQGNQQQPQQGYQPQNQGYQNAPMNKPQSGYSQGPQDNGSIPF